MSLYSFGNNGLSEIKMATMSNLKIRERQDLQDVLRTNIEAVAPDVLIISEEYSGWQDSKRRIDLLGIDRQGSLVVFELKRTADGGHMDLQAIRYAAMVSALTFNEVVDLFAQFLKKHGRMELARDLIVEHVNGDEDEVEACVGELVRVVLVSQDFDSEITTTVLWLNEQGLDIRCVRLHPYQIGEQIVFDIQQILPLPEATDYMVKKRQKEAGQKAAITRESRDFTKYRVTTTEVDARQLVKRRAILAIVTALHKAGVSPEQMRDTINQSRQRFYEVDGLFESQEDFIEAALRSSSQNDEKIFDQARYFTADDELLRCDGKTYAFSNQWGSRTEQKMNDLIAAHGEGLVSFEREDD
jgi:hypothetical protein